jgi:hypothetical protein
MELESHSAAGAYPGRFLPIALALLLALAAKTKSAVGLAAADGEPGTARASPGLQGAGPLSLAPTAFIASGVSHVLPRRAHLPITH